MADLRMELFLSLIWAKIHFIPEVIAFTFQHFEMNSTKIIKTFLNKKFTIIIEKAF